MAKQDKETIEKVEEEMEQIPNVEYTDDENLYLSHIVKRMVRARNFRDKNHAEFDNMDFHTYYDTNAKAANSYIPPKRNKEDTRVVTGTTHEKGNTLLSALLNYNLEPNVEAFDEQDLPVNELGETMEALIKKSRQIEDYDLHRPLIYKELLDQGTCYVEETWVEEQCVKKELQNKQLLMGGIKLKEVKWTEKLERVYGKCKTNLIPGTKIFLGDMRRFYIYEQPFIFTVEHLNYDEVKAQFGDWERWKFVPRTIKKLVDEPESEFYRDWSLYEVEPDKVEVVKYQDKWRNELMITINGVMMLPIGFPLSAISPSGEYSIAKGDVEPISKFFSVSKSIPAKTKVDQEVLDEMLKLIVLKTQQSFKPPLANNTGKILSSKVFMPGKIHQDIDPNMLQPVVEAKGVNQAEFNAFELIKRIVDEKSVSPTFAGESPQGKQTATEILELKKQQMMKLGLAIWGVVNLERQLSWLRIYNIIDHWTEEVDEDVVDVKEGVQDIVKRYRKVSVETDLENGQSGMKMIEFSPEASTKNTPEGIKEIMKEEDELSRPGMPVRKVYINPKLLRKMKLEWFITINPTEKDSSELNRVLFVQNIQDAAMIFGIQSLNMDYLKDRFAILAKEDPEKFFNQGQQGQQPMSPMAAMQGGQQQPGQMGQMGQMGGQIGKELAQGVDRPSLNQIVGQ